MRLRADGVDSDGIRHCLQPIRCAASGKTYVSHCVTHDHVTWPRRLNRMRLCQFLWDVDVVIVSHRPTPGDNTATSSRHCCADIAAKHADRHKGDKMDALPTIFYA